MLRKKMTLAEAHATVVAARPLIRPNNGFWRQLMAFEEELYGTTTVHFQETPRGSSISDRRPVPAADVDFARVVTAHSGHPQACG